MNGHRLFKTFYYSFYGLGAAILLGLLALPPGDLIRQSVDNDQRIYILFIAICYGATATVGLFILGTRLRTNRLALKNIDKKSWVPIEDGEVSKNVRKEIVAGFRRSAAIAWDCRPRIASQPTTVVNEPETKDIIVMVPGAEHGNTRERMKWGCIFWHKHPVDVEEKDEQTVEIPPPQPVWGEIAHNGWSSPTSPDLPSLEYTTVILELPHLIEARAVSMAPADLESTSDPPMPDLRAVEVLQRPAPLGLRDYISHLTSIGVLTTSVEAFLATYEQARFSPHPLSEPEFRHLMALFAELLQNIQPLNPTILASLDINAPESDIDDDASSTSTPRSRSLASAHTPSSRSGSEGTIHTAPSRRPGTQSTPTKRSGLSTAPATPRSRKSKKGARPPLAKSSSSNGLAQNRRPYDGSSGTSSSSLRSSSMGSVIRLSTTNESGQLPYTLTIPPVR